MLDQTQCESVRTLVPSAFPLLMSHKNFEIFLVIDGMNYFKEYGKTIESDRNFHLYHMDFRIWSLSSVQS
ncbi:hypothetical protein GWI33_004296 [Rhynchophorus ferrugineus]|uniref:Uncharacterized protein n=1 Tax=Rhynchophorus ferrugineus TaxID=354439 RepID=A0A834IIY4_RHYFE|nr:hypothetical protein GWI33_004296 [Rhynchophorus ferrugineus]